MLSLALGLFKQYSSDHLTRVLWRFLHQPADWMWWSWDYYNYKLSSCSTAWREDPLVLYSLLPFLHIFLSLFLLIQAMEFHEKGDKHQQALGVLLLGQSLSHLDFLLVTLQGRVPIWPHCVLLFENLVNGPKLRVAAASSHRPGVGAAVTAPPHLSRQGRSYSNVL